MATIQPNIEKDQSGFTTRVTWSGLGSSDDGAPVSFPGAADTSVHVNGTFSGASCVIEGTLENTPASYHQLHDNTGADLAYTASAINVVAENTYWIRPRVVGGTSPSVNIILLFRRTR